MNSLVFTKSKYDPNLYFQVMHHEPIILLFYVDDLFFRGNEKHVVECKKKLVEEFELNNLGLMHYFIGLEVWQILEGIFLN